MADKIAVLRKGRVEQFGRPLDLFNTPANRFVAGFIGSPAMNFVPGIVADGGVRLSTGTVLPLQTGRFGAQAGQTVEVGMRAGHLRMDRAGLQVRVDTVEQLGSESYLYGNLDDGTAMTVHQQGQVAVGRGDVVTIAPDPATLHLFDAQTGASLAA